MYCGSNAIDALKPANLRMSDPSIFDKPLKYFPESRLFDQVREGKAGEEGCVEKEPAGKNPA